VLLLGLLLNIIAPTPMLVESLRLREREEDDDDDGGGGIAAVVVVADEEESWGVEVVNEDIEVKEDIVVDEVVEKSLLLSPEVLYTLMAGDVLP
jgi:hypothetical protein